MSFGSFASSWLVWPGTNAYRIYADSPTMPTASAGDTSSVTLGLEFNVSANTELRAILWWQPTTGSAASNRTIGLYSTTNGTTGTLISSKTQAVSGVGWQTVAFDTPITLTPGTTYRAAVYHPDGQYVAISGYYLPGGPGYGAVGEGVVIGSVTVPGSTEAINNGQGTYEYAAMLKFPAAQGGAHYGIDIVVEGT